jgi:hypothetical protein
VQYDVDVGQLSLLLPSPSTVGFSVLEYSCPNSAIYSSTCWAYSYPKQQGEQHVWNNALSKVLPGVG